LILTFLLEQISRIRLQDVFLLWNFLGVLMIGLVMELGQFRAEALANVVYDLLSNKPGFSGLDDVFYCEVLNRPFPVGRDQRGSYIFSSNFLFRMKQ
jgi:membrane-associated PAP2 superfamily phosphatase